MSLNTFSLSTLAPSPWKNGGGITYEIARSECKQTDFDWRVSIAQISQSGAFSQFMGVDRTIILLDGAQVRLHSKPISGEHFLETTLQPLSPFAFAGEAQIDCEVLSNDTANSQNSGDFNLSHDFNVMTRRGVCNADVQITRAAATVASAQAGLLFAAQGAWVLNENDTDLTLNAGEGVWWDKSGQEIGQDTGRAAMQLKPLNTDSALSALIIVRFSYL